MNINPQDFNLSQAAYSVGQLLQILPFGRTSLYYAVKRGDLKANKLGKKTLFLAVDVAEFLANLQAGSKGEAANVK